jgi:CelD/BcsL family acetyltransferase involved in cellulose biosynthesis
MVDIGTTAFAAQARRSDTASLRCEVHRGREAALALVDRMPSDAIHTGYQHPAFLRAWITNAPHEPVFLVFRVDGAGPVLLPLENAGGCILAYAGERHANGNFPIGRADDIAALAKAGQGAIVAAMRAAGLDANAILLERQLQALDGVANPFVFAQSAPSPNPALALSLEGGFDEVLKRHSAKRRRKRFRGQERRLGEMGGYRFVDHVDAKDVSTTLDLFFDMKARRFAEAGIRDVFAEEYVKHFFHDLFVEGSKRVPRSHELKILEANGTPIAIIGCTIHAGRLTVEFGTFEESYGDLGPGDMLFFLAIRDTAEKGLEIFDFGIGDEFYKRGWCELETIHMDTIIPLSAGGSLFAVRKRARASIVRSIKGSKVLWPLVKRLRKTLPTSG